MKKALFIQLSPCICNIIQILEASPLETSLLEKLTITIPVYNDEKYIRHAVESCLGQAGKIVIYDNASTDNTSQICSALAAQHPAVKYVRHPENIGAFANFKRALFDCQTEYFCWVGSHDLLGDGYSVQILEEMEKEAFTALGAGTIIHIDEEGIKTGFQAKATWANFSNDVTALDRVGICLTKLRKDCSIFYGIYRTEKLKDAWIDKPCLGFDRVILGRICAVGKIAYVEKALFFARNLDKSRNSKTDRERRAKEVGSQAEQPLAKDVFTRNKMMVQTILDQAQSQIELGRALDYIQKINRKYQNRRRYQRKRIVLCLLCAFFIGAFILALYF